MCSMYAANRIALGEYMIIYRYIERYVKNDIFFFFLLLLLCVYTPSGENTLLKRGRFFIYFYVVHCGLLHLFRRIFEINRKLSFRVLPAGAFVVAAISSKRYTPAHQFVFPN